MKHLIIFLLLCGYINGYSQTAVYTPFKTNGTARWNYTEMEPPLFPGSPTTYYYQFTIVDEDTVINGFTYNRVIGRRTKYYLPNASSIYIADGPDSRWFLFRQDGMRTYIAANDGTGERLVYDFNKKRGDTVYYYTGHTFKSIVTNIDSILVTGEYRTRLTVDKSFGRPSFSPLDLVTGYGGESGLFYQESSSGYYYKRFICYSDSNGSYPGNNCAYIYPFGTTPPTGIQNITTENKTVYPNPFNNELHINTPGNVYIYNSMGQKVFDAATDGKQSISTTQLAAGVYYLTLKDKEGNIITQQKLLKE